MRKCIHVHISTFNEFELPAIFFKAKHSKFIKRAPKKGGTPYVYRKYTQNKERKMNINQLKHPKKPQPPTTKTI